MSLPPHKHLRLWLAARLQHAETSRLLYLAGIAGAGGALAIVAFRSALALAERILYGRDAGLVAAASALPPLWRVLIPALGGILAGILLHLSRRIQTSAASDYMEAISLRDGAISTRLSLMRSASSLASVASGGSIGREGPMVQLASLAGFLCARWHALPAPQRRLLVACGGAAGISAAYNAPVAGALFIAEIVLRTISLESLAPLLAASVIASIVSHPFFGGAPIYTMPQITAPAGAEFLWHGMLGLLAGFGAPLFLGLLEGAKQLFRRLPASDPLRLGLGGLSVGLISLGVPQVWGNGYSVVSQMLNGAWLWQPLLVVLAFKLLATALTIGSGAIGGAFTPSLFVGAALGTLCGSALHAAGLGGDPGALAVSGMAAFLAATLHAPLTAIVIVVEMTGNLALLPAVMLAAALALPLSRLLRARSIYGSSLRPQPSRPFSQLTVADVLRPAPPCVSVGASLGALREAYLACHWQNIYLLDTDGRFLGAMSIHALGERLHLGEADAPLPAELLRRDYPSLRIDAALADALATFASHAGERLPVLDSERRLLGHAAKTDVLLLLGEGLAAN